MLHWDYLIDSYVAGSVADKTFVRITLNSFQNRLSVYSSPVWFNRKTGSGIMPTVLLLWANVRKMEKKHYMNLS